MTRVVGSVLLLGAALLAAPRARADGGPLLVVVESPEPRQADAIRRDVGVGLAVEVVTMDHPRARVARGILMIAVVDGGRRALLFYRSRGGFSTWREASAPDGGPAGWIAETAVALASNAGQWRLQMEVLDPFGPGTPDPPAGNLPIGVLDPWGVAGERSEARSGAADRSGAPPPVRGPAVPSVEPAAGLSAPRPARP